MPRVRESSSYKRRVYWCRVFVIISIFTSVIGCVIMLCHSLLESPLLPSVPYASTSLQQVSILFRHGDRNPIAPYPKDPYHSYIWKGGYGALTQKGMNQLYKLGRRLRGTYRSFISDEYQTADILVRSSDAERCIMSAQALLAAFYQPSANDEFVPGLAWCPVPVFQIQSTADKWIKAEAPCPRLEREWEQAVSNFRLPSNRSIRSLYQELSDIAGMEISSFREIVSVVDMLRIQALKGWELPEWAIKFPYHVFAQLYFDYFNLHTSNLVQKRLTGGPLLKEILDNMAKRRNGTDKHKLYLYSGHDITQLNVMRTMGIAGENLKPGYGANLIFELHEVDGFEDHEVKILFQNDADTTEPGIIKIPSCGEPCFLDKLTRILEPVLPGNWEGECLS